MKRRGIGPAYERSPLERLKEWAMRNMLLLIAASVGSVIFVYGTNWAFDKFFPALNAGGSAGAEVTVSSNSPPAMAVKVVGVVLIVAFMYRQSTRR